MDQSCFLQKMSWWVQQKAHRGQLIVIATLCTLCTRLNVENNCVKRAHNLFHDVWDYFLKIPGRQPDVLLSHKN